MNCVLGNLFIRGWKYSDLEKWVVKLWEFKGKYIREKNFECTCEKGKDKMIHGNKYRVLGDWRVFLFLIFYTVLRGFCDCGSYLWIVLILEVISFRVEI